MRLFQALLSDKFVERIYIKAGKKFGDAASYGYLGECTEFKKYLNNLVKWEEEYAQRGYRTVNLDAFVELGGYGNPIDSLIGQRLKLDEKLVFHAQVYREEFLGRTKPSFNLEKMIHEGKPQSGNYKLPSTEN